MKADLLKKITLNALITMNIEEKKNLGLKSIVGGVEIGPFRLLARTRGFEPLTLGLEMCGFVIASYIVLLIYNNYFQDVYENGLKTHSPKLQKLNEK